MFTHKKLAIVGESDKPVVVRQRFECITFNNVDVDLTLTDTKYKKVVLVGNSGSNKTVVVRQLLGYKDHPTVSTVGAEVNPYCIESDGVARNDDRQRRSSQCIGSTKYSLWDTAGKERYRGLGSGYLFDADIVLVFEGGEKYQTVKEWMREIEIAAPTALVYRVYGKITNKLSQVKRVLAQNA